MYGIVVDSFNILLFLCYDCTVVSCFSFFGKTCTSDSLYIAAGRYSKMLTAHCDSILGMI